MIELWLAIAALTILGLTFVVVPFVRYQTDETKLAASSDWFTNRKTELEQELQAGLFTQAEYEQALTELKLTAKDELVLAKAEQGEQKPKRLTKKPVLLAALLLVLIAIPFYLVKGHYQAIGSWQTTMKNLPALSTKIVEQNNQQVTMQELTEFALGLRTKLAEEEKPVGWMLLGRVLMSMQDINGAIDAFKKSYDLAPQNISNSLSYAQALQLKGEQWDIQRSITILQGVLTQQPQNDTAVILFGEGNMMLENFDMAQRSFALAIQMISPQDPRAPSIQKRIEFLQQQLGQAPAASPEQMSEQTANATQTSVPALNIEVQLAEPVAQQLSKFKYLFVFAKTEQMPMPIAVKKLAIGDFPVKVQLTDADLMLPDLSLSKFDSVNVFARLSVDEQAPISSGEWQGNQDKVATTQQQPIIILIDKEHP